MIVKLEHLICMTESIAGESAFVKWSLSQYQKPPEGFSRPKRFTQNHGNQNPLIFEKLKMEAPWKIGWNIKHCQRSLTAAPTFTPGQCQRRLTIALMCIQVNNGETMTKNQVTSKRPPRNKDPITRLHRRPTYSRSAHHLTTSRRISRFNTMLHP